MSSDNTPPLESRRLDHLPLVAQAIKRLRIAEVVDSLLPVDPRSHVTNGQCAEALILSILTNGHTLYLVDERLGKYDLKTLMGWDAESGDVAEFLDDERLGNFLEALHDCEGGGVKVHGTVAINAVKEYELMLERLHADNSSIMFHGAYKGSHDPEDPESLHAVPNVTHGHSKDHRPDLKQILFSTTVTADGGVPIFGRAASGNRAEALEVRTTMDRLAAMLPDPKGSTLVNDSKFFSGETLLLAKKHAFHWITLIPDNVGVRKEALAALREAKARGETLPLLKESVGSDHAPETWRGFSRPLVYNYKDENDTVTPIPLRALVVESSSLRKQKLKSLTRAKEKERLALERASQKLRKNTLSCDEDALKIAKLLLEKRKPRFHKVEIQLVATSLRVKRARRGRPAKDEPERFETVWSTTLSFEEDKEAFERLLDSESCFALATDRPSTGPDALSDQDFLRFYKEQFRVEGNFKTAKGPLEVAPVFLKNEKRIASLVLIYILALMVYALIQRETRARLEAAQSTIPGNLGRTSQPTTEVVFRLLEGLHTVRQGGVTTLVDLTTEQARLLDLLGNDLLHRPNLLVQAPAPPRRTQRGYYPAQPQSSSVKNRRARRGAS